MNEISIPRLSKIVNVQSKKEKNPMKMFKKLQSLTATMALIT